jgi:hypothetical protein
MPWTDYWLAGQRAGDDVQMATALPKVEAFPRLMLIADPRFAMDAIRDEIALVVAGARAKDPAPVQVLWTAACSEFEGALPGGSIERHPNRSAAGRQRRPVEVDWCSRPSDRAARMTTSGEIPRAMLSIAVEPTKATHSPAAHDGSAAIAMPRAATRTTATQSAGLAERAGSRCVGCRLRCGGLGSPDLDMAAGSRVPRHGVDTATGGDLRWGSPGQAG